MVADALSCPSQVIGAEWTLHQEVFDWLQKRWPVTVDLFASSLNHRCVILLRCQIPWLRVLMPCSSLGILFLLAPFHFALILQVLAELRLSPGAVLTLIAPFWPQSECFPDLLNLPLESPLPLPDRWDMLRQPQLRRFH